MEIKIHSLHFDADQKLIDFVRTKVNKLSQFYEHVIVAEVFLRLDNSDTANNKVSEIRLEVPNVKEMFAKKQTKSFEESVDLAVEALRSQLLKHKEKARKM